MKRKYFIAALMLATIVGVWYGCGSTGSSPTNLRFGILDDELTINSQGSMTFESGASADFESGAELKIGGTALTPTAAELNYLSGLTAVAAELNQLDGVTAGAAAASKAVVLDSGKRVTGVVAYIDTSHADGDTLTAAESGKTIAHYNSIKKTLVLPPAAAGLWNEYIVDDGDSLVIDANASDKIVDGTTEYEKQTTVAGTVKLKAVDGTYWYMVGATGTWTGY